MSEFDLQVRHQIERLTECTYREIETAVAAKRSAWWREHPSPAGQAQPATPREAFERLFFDYMGLVPDDLPIVEESDEHIVWRSENPCPTLDACQKLGLDTRIVCRAAYEKSTQAFVSHLDPQLRFLRSYTEIRPHTGYCLERIVRLDFNKIMRLAIEEARQSRAEGNKGYGAVILRGQELLARAHDTAVTRGDPSLHAEVNAIRQAVQAGGDPNLSGAVLFSTCEPCPMCSALAVWANLTAIVYGASIEQTARLGKARIAIPARELIDRSPVMIEVIGGVLEQDCLALYQ